VVSFFFLYHIILIDISFQEFYMATQSQ